MESCQNSVDRMDVGGEVKTLGSGGKPLMWTCLRLGILVSEAAPKVRRYYQAGVRSTVDHRCIVTLRTSGRSGSLSWHRIWETVTFVTAMCARREEKAVHPAR